MPSVFINDQNAVGIVNSVIAVVLLHFLTLTCNTDSEIKNKYQYHSCSCIEDYKRGADGRTCLPLSESCTEGVDCGETAGIPANQTTFGDVFYGYDNRTKEITTGQILKATFR